MKTIKFTVKQQIVKGETRTTCIDIEKDEVIGRQEEPLKSIE